MAIQNGYIVKRNRKRNRMENLQRTIWIEHYGEIPKNVHVHHINGNKLDNRIENLLAISNSEHMKLHCKMTAEKECGNQDYRKCWVCKQYDDIKNLKRGGTGCLAHGECFRKYKRKREAEIRNSAECCECGLD